MNIAMRPDGRRTRLSTIRVLLDGGSRKVVPLEFGVKPDSENRNTIIPITVCSSDLVSVILRVGIRLLVTIMPKDIFISRILVLKCGQSLPIIGSRIGITAIRNLLIRFLFHTAHIITTIMMETRLEIRD